VPSLAVVAAFKRQPATRGVLLDRLNLSDEGVVDTAQDVRKLRSAE
jgi:hypothetical protein